MEKYTGTPEDGQKMMESANVLPVNFGAYEHYLNSYKRKILELHAEMQKLETYIKAKENIQGTINEMDQILKREKPSTYQNLGDLMKLYQFYEQVIHRYEKSTEIPDTALEQAKTSLSELSDIINELIKIDRVAKKSPESN